MTPEKLKYNWSLFLHIRNSQANYIQDQKCHAGKDSGKEFG